VGNNKLTFVLGVIIQGELKGFIRIIAVKVPPDCTFCRSAGAAHGYCGPAWIHCQQPQELLQGGAVVSAVTACSVVQQYLYCFLISELYLHVAHGLSPILLHQPVRLQSPQRVHEPHAERTLARTQQVSSVLHKLVPIKFFLHPALSKGSSGGGGSSAEEKMIEHVRLVGGGECADHSAESKNDL
jgi:hypothetical protein